MIDRLKSTVLNAKSKPGADCDTDHYLVTANLRLKAHKQITKKPSPRYDTEKLINPVTSADFAVYCSNRFAPLLEDWTANQKCPEEIWEDMKKTYAEAAEVKLGRKVSRSQNHISAQK